MNDLWGHILAALAGGLGTKIFDYLRGSKKDAGELTIQMWLQLSKEQQEWRLVQTREIERLQGMVTDLQRENVRLLGKVAELEARNADLHDDNERLELRVKQLESELDEKKHAAVGL